VCVHESRRETGMGLMGSISRVKPCNRTKGWLFGCFTSICIRTAAFSFGKGRRTVQTKNLHLAHIILWLLHKELRIPS